MNPVLAGNLIGSGLWLLQWWAEVRKLPPPPPAPAFDHPDDALAEIQRTTLEPVVTGRMGRLTVPRFDLRALHARVLGVMLAAPGRKE